MARVHRPAVHTRINQVANFCCPGASARRGNLFKRPLTLSFGPRKAVQSELLRLFVTTRRSTSPGACAPSIEPGLPPYLKPMNMPVSDISTMYAVATYNPLSRLTSRIATQKDHPSTQPRTKVVGLRTLELFDPAFCRPFHNLHQN